MRATLTALALLTLYAASAGVRAAEVAAKGAPQFTATAPADWINSAPLRMESFRGRVLLLDVWTFDCWNCYRSFAWLKDLEARWSGRDFAVVGIHSPEFAHERERARVNAKVREFGIRHPVMLDNDFAYWKALGNRAWPAFYVIDRQGRIRGAFIGETHTGDARAQRIEALLEELHGEE